MDNITSTDGCSPLYLGHIDIPIEDIVASTHSFENRDLVAAQKDRRSTSTSSLEFHEFDPRRKEEEEVHLLELYFLVGPLNMSE